MVLAFHSVYLLRSPLNKMKGGIYRRSRAVNCLYPSNYAFDWYSLRNKRIIINVSFKHHQMIKIRVKTTFHMLVLLCGIPYIVLDPTNWPNAFCLCAFLFNEISSLELGVQKTIKVRVIETLICEGWGHCNKLSAILMVWLWIWVFYLHF